MPPVGPTYSACADLAGAPVFASRKIKLTRVRGGVRFSAGSQLRNLADLKVGTTTNACQLHGLTAVNWMRRNSSLSLGRTCLPAGIWFCLRMYATTAAASSLLNVPAASGGIA